MATIDLNPPTLGIRFSRGEKVAGLLRDIEEPLDRVRAVRVEGDGLDATQGVRAPGLALPGRRKVGTWRGRGRRTAVCVRAGEPAVRISLDGARWTELLIGTPEAEDVAARLQSVIAPAES